jgi:hypothetical protein
LCCCLTCVGQKCVKHAYSCSIIHTEK